MDMIWTKLRRLCDERWAQRGLCERPAWPEFAARLDAEFRRLAELLWGIYGDRPDFAYQLEAIVADAFASYEARPEALKRRDRELSPESGWFLDSRQVGAVAYVDRFAGTFKGLEKRIPYLEELGVTYLHLMPFFKAPETENDGGYAVSSYRETNPALGTMADLEHLAAALAKKGILLVADFVFNHSSDEHEWAIKAKAGDAEHEAFYWTFANHDDTRRFQPWLRDIFPETRQGSFSFSPEMHKWVWTTFNSFQWDLNYRNPAVFNAMAQEMVSIANRGIAILRLDAVAFIWKQEGTPCENLPEAHTIIQAFQAIARLACPSLLFKSEAIVHPDDIEKYIDLRECQLSYNPLLMAELWEAAATKEVRLLAHSLRKRQHVPAGCAWINYVRCHDDIGWTFADEDAGELGIKGYDHRRFLNSFYMGEFPGSFSRGVGFQYNPVNGDRRICGSAASLAGVEQAREDGSGQDLDTAVNRLLLLYGIACSAGGIPLLYLGDEIAAANRYEYEDDPAQANDSRWVHRPLWSDGKDKLRRTAGTVENRVFTGLRQLLGQRKAHPVFGVQQLGVLESVHPAVLAFRKQADRSVLTVIGNFADSAVVLPAEGLRRLIGEDPGTDLLSGKEILPWASLEIEPCGMLWILQE